MLKRSPSAKTNGTKFALFFLLRAPTHHSFTFNLQFLYTQKRKVPPLYNSVRDVPFWFCLVFIKVYYFAQQNA